MSSNEIIIKFQDEILRKAVQKHKGKNWKKIGMGYETDLFCI